MSEWISVDERLPKKRGEYMAYLPKQRVMGMDVEARGAILRWSGNKWHSSFAVSHWMPLPEPPK